MSVVIKEVLLNSPADSVGIKAGETLLSINGNQIIDVLDYRFYETDPKVCLRLMSPNGTEREISVRKGQYEPLGLEFETYLMDKQHSCRNKCIFCFIDQLPKGMRESLYFKDDDSRLSFLFGNYITLTNISDHEIERIIKMHISPINVSVHATNPELRCKIMKNRFAGRALSILRRFAEGGIKLNCQFVLCPGVNDGEELIRSLTDLMALGENVQSIACVPVGVTRYREGLFPLTTYVPKTAAATVDIIENFGEEFKKQRGMRTVFASDEFYLLAERPIPGPEFYEDFAQLENGVGMMANLKDEFLYALEDCELPSEPRKVTMATGEAAAPFLDSLLDELRQKCNNITIEVVPIVNDFFGGTVNVAGLLTGQDMARQLAGKDLGDEVLIPAVTLRQQEDVFLDDMTLEQLCNRLGKKVTPVINDGQCLLEAILGGDTECLNR